MKRIDMYFTLVTISLRISFFSGALAYSSAHFGAGAGLIHLDNVACSGNESNLTDCSHSSIVSCTNGHSEDAGVRCQGTNNTKWFNT